MKILQCTAYIVILSIIFLVIVVFPKLLSVILIFDILLILGVAITLIFPLILP